MAGLKTLKEEEFDYSEFVTKFKNGCGTVCCAWGWMPRFVPEAGVKWDESKPCIINQDADNLFKVINNYDVMFYGSNKYADSKKFGHGWGASLPQVINRIEHIINIYKNKNGGWIPHTFNT